MAKNKSVPAGVVAAAAEIAAGASTPGVASVSDASSTNENAAATKARGPKGVADTAVITLKVTVNPKREGSKAHGRYAFYKDGMTVGAALDAGVTTPDLVYDAKHGFITIQGYDAGEIVQPKPKAPKVEKTAKEPKAPKAAKSEAQVAAEQQAENEAQAEKME